MSYNWIHAEEYSINCLLLMDRWMLRLMVGNTKLNADPEFSKLWSVALAYHPAIRWYIENKCPESAERVAQLADNAPPNLSPDEVRQTPAPSGKPQDGCGCIKSIMDLCYGRCTKKRAACYATPAMPIILSICKYDQQIVM